MEDWKIKIAVLWLVIEVGGIWIGLIEHYIPGYMEEVVAQTTPEMVLFLVVVEMILPVMAFLTLTLKDSIARWANIILGIVFAILLASSPIMMTDLPAGYLAPFIVITIVSIVASVLIAWYAWKSKQKA